MHNPPLRLRNTVTNWSANDGRTYCRLLHKLLKKRPEAKFRYDKSDSTAHKFLKRQLKYIRDGMTEDAAFTKAEEDFALFMDKEREKAALLVNVAGTSKVRSFMDFYEQTAEYEGRNKVMQLKRDLPKFLRSKEEFDIFNNEQIIHNWGTVQATFVHSKNADQTPAADEFYNRAQRAVEHHRDRVQKFDGLSGLSDEMILWNARDAYRNIRKGSKAIYRELIDGGVKVDKDGHIDTSKVENTDIKRALNDNPVYKLILSSHGDLKDHYVESEPRVATPSVPTPSEKPFGKPILWSSPNPYNQKFEDVKSSQVESDNQRKIRLKEL